MKPDLTLKLGDFVFQGFEIPESIPFGGCQKLAVHELVGGVRVIDSLGRQDEDLTWNGVSRGPKARDRMLHLDFLRAQGKAQTLTWGTQSYQVVIEKLICTFQRWYQLPYTITCKVVQNNTDPVQTVDNTSLDQQMQMDYATAQALVAQANNGPLTGLFGSFGSAFSGVSSFISAAQSTINGVLQPLRAVQAQVASLVIGATGVLGTIGGLGSAIPGVGRAVANMNNALASCSTLSTLGQLTGVLGRMSGNLGAVQGSATIIPVAGGNLYQMSSQAYGTVTGWGTIANANGVTDPQVSGIQNIVVPKTMGAAS